MSVIIGLRHKADYIHTEMEDPTLTSINVGLGHKADLVHAETEGGSTHRLLETCFHKNLTMSNDRPRAFGGCYQ